LTLASLAGCIEPPLETARTTAELSAGSAGDRAQLALRWAPVHYQDVDQTGGHALGGAADYLAAYDFDGNLDGRDNWDHAGNAAFPLRATAYYSVVETSTHWFVVYLFFHPRDWSDSVFEFDTEHQGTTYHMVFSGSVGDDGGIKGSIAVAGVEGTFTAKKQ